MTVRAIGDVAAKLTALGSRGSGSTYVQEREDGDDWSFKSVVLPECVITSATPTAATVSGAPSATFSGFSLAAKAESKTGAEAKIP